MSVKKIGEAKLELADELWFVEGKADKFLMNRRLVDTRPEVKAFRSYGRHVNTNTPPMTKPKKREAYFQARDEYTKKFNECLTKVYGKIKEESFTDPIPLRRAKDFDHKSDWRYCLYHGNIYQFDKAGYSDEDMIRQISAIEPL